MICFNAIPKTEIKVSILNNYHYAFFLISKGGFLSFLISLEMPSAFHGSQNDSQLLRDKNHIFPEDSEGLCLVVKVSHIFPLLFI